MSKRYLYMEQRHAAARNALGLSGKEWRVIRDAAQDAHMNVFEYARLMLLAAAGMGGVIEHLERVSDASARVEDGGVPPLRFGDLDLP